MITGILADHEQSIARRSGYGMMGSL